MPETCYSTRIATLSLALLACAEVHAAGADKVFWPICHPVSCDEPAVNRAVPLYASPSASEVERAGKSHCLFRWAVPTHTPNYVGYYVGGGGAGCCPCRGAAPRCPLDGTWGRDYRGCLPRIVALGWTRPGRYQGGDGKYDPDGPRCPHYTPEMLFAPP